MIISHFKNNLPMNSNLVYPQLLDAVRATDTLVEDSMDADAAIIWSVLWHGKMSDNKRVWDHYRSQDKPVVVIEVGGIQRGTTWKVGLNGINRDAYFGPDNNNDDRHRLLGLSLTPWRTHGEYILICGQHDKSLQWQKMPSMSTWVSNTINEIRKYTDRPIILRPHPRCPLHHIEHEFKNVRRQVPEKLNGTYDDFNLNFDNIHATVSWSSNPGIHSILNGVPAFVGTSSLAYDVGNDIDFMHDIEAPLMPNRQQWLNDYAHTEWHANEIDEQWNTLRLIMQ